MLSFEYTSRSKVLSLALKFYGSKRRFASFKLTKDIVVECDNQAKEICEEDRIIFECMMHTNTKNIIYYILLHDPVMSERNL